MFFEMCLFLSHPSMLTWYTALFCLVLVSDLRDLAGLSAFSDQCNFLGFDGPGAHPQVFSSSSDTDQHRTALISRFRTHPCMPGIACCACVTSVRVHETAIWRPFEVQ